jgi:hypothetical protein
MYLDVSRFDLETGDLLEHGCACDARVHKSPVYVCWQRGCTGRDVCI